MHLSAKSHCYEAVTTYIPVLDIWVYSYWVLTLVK